MFQLCFFLIALLHPVDSSTKTFYFFHWFFLAVNFSVNLWFEGTSVEFDFNPFLVYLLFQLFSRPIYIAIVKSIYKSFLIIWSHSLRLSKKVDFLSRIVIISRWINFTSFWIHYTRTTVSIQCCFGWFFCIRFL